MPPYACFPAFRNATQRNATQEFSRNKKVLRTVLFTQPQTPRLLAVIRKQVETPSIFSATPEAKSTNQRCVYVNQWLYGSAKRCVAFTKCWKTRFSPMFRHLFLTVLSAIKYKLFSLSFTLCARKSHVMSDVRK